MMLVALAACKTSNDVASHRMIQKRKYRDGFHIAAFQKHQEGVSRFDSRLQESEIGPIDAEKEEHTENRTAESNEQSLEYSTEDVEMLKSKSQEDATLVDRNKKLNSGLSSESVDSEPGIQENEKQSKEAQADPRQQGIASLVLGILSLTIFMSVPIINIVLPIIGMRLGRKADYAGESLGSIGRVINIIALVLGILYTLFFGLMILFLLSFEYGYF